MSYRFAIPAALAATAVIAAPAAAQKKPSIDQVEKHLSATRSLSASFTQTDGKNRSVNGTLSIKRPGKVRFDYGKNANMLMVSDGTKLHFLDYEVGQKSSWDIKDSPLSVLLENNPNLERIARIVPSKDDRVVIVRARDARRPEFGTLIMAFTKNSAYPGGLRLEGWTAIDAQNKKTAIKLSGQRYNVSIPDTKFAYRDVK